MAAALDYSKLSLVPSKQIPNAAVSNIRDVWKYNLEAEFKILRQIIQRYKYVAMDTEFPGVVARPTGEFESRASYQYQLLRCNVEILNIIQLGLTFMDEQGNTPEECCTWQFNFRFDVYTEMYAQDSIEMLRDAGIQFAKLVEDGIDPVVFAELLMTSGIILCDDVKWLCFHAGYDMAYLLKMLTQESLPEEETEFIEVLGLYFYNIYDIKYITKSCRSLRGGLQEMADQLQLKRIGPQHQAGSDSLLTGRVYFKIREIYFNNNIDDAKFSGQLFGLAPPYWENEEANVENEAANAEAEERRLEAEAIDYYNGVN